MNLAFFTASGLFTDGVRRGTAGAHKEWLVFIEFFPQNMELGIIKSDKHGFCLFKLDDGSMQLVNLRVVGHRVTSFKNNL